MIEAVVRWSIEPTWKTEWTINEHGGQEGAVGISGKEGAHAVERAWRMVSEDLVGRNPAGMARMFREALERHEGMRQAARGSGLCMVSWRRSAVEKHEQDDLDTTLGDVWTDGLRDSLAALERDEATWAGEVARCAGSEAPLARRCAIHAMGRGQSKNASEKIRWAEERHREDDYQSHHERYEVVRQAWPDADAETKRWFVEGRVRRAEEAAGEQTELAARSLYDWMTGLARDTGDEGVLRVEAERQIAAHPNWVPREWSGFTHYGVQGWVGKASPWESVGGLKANMAGIAQVLEWEPDESGAPGAPDTVWGGTAEIESTAKGSPEWGIKLVETMATEGRWSHPAWTPLCSAMEGWSEAEWKRGHARIEWGAVRAGDEGQALAVCRLALARAGRTGGRQQATRRVLRMVEEVWPGLRWREMETPAADYMGDAASKPDGVALDAVVGALREAVNRRRKGAGSSKGVERECLKTLGKVMGAEGNGTHARGCLAAVVVMNGHWMAEETPEVVERYATRQMGARGENEVRRAVRQSLRYAELRGAAWVEQVRQGLRRELESWDQEVPENELKDMAEKWAQGMMQASDWQEEEGGDEIGLWSLVGLWEGVVDAVLRGACVGVSVRSYGLRATAVERGRMWERGVWPTVKQLATQGELTRGHRETLTGCFADIGQRGQEALEALCRQGDKLRRTERFVKEGRDIDRRAAVRLASHVETGCCTAGWWASLEQIAGWTTGDDRLDEPLLSMARQVLARHGM